MTFLEIWKDYWFFIVAGLIVLALVVYWLVESILSRKAREKELAELENIIKEQEQKKLVKSNEETKVVQEVKVEEKVESDKKE